MTVSHELRTPLNTIHGCACSRPGMAPVEQRARALEGHRAQHARPGPSRRGPARRLAYRERQAPAESAPRRAAGHRARCGGVDAARRRRQEHRGRDEHGGRPFGHRRSRSPPAGVWNFLSNALKFTPARGQVAVMLDVRAGTVRLTVMDSGIGIAREFLPFVFERFRQGDSGTTRAHGGLGLGLAIVRHLVELHGGSVEVDSPGVNQGTTFGCRVPARPPLRRGPARGRGGLIVRPRPSRSPSAARLDGRRVLVVDDEAERALLSHVFEHAGALDDGRLLTGSLGAAAARDARRAGVRHRDAGRGRLHIDAPRPWP